MSESGLEVPEATGNTNNDHACAVASAIDKTELTYTFADDMRGTLTAVGGPRSQEVGEERTCT